MRLYWGDTQTTRAGEVRTLAEELSQSLATTVLNPEWLATVQAQGYTGASDISNRVNVLFGWSATTHAITDSPRPVSRPIRRGRRYPANRPAPCPGP